MPPWQAQMVAAWLNEAAEAALQDAFLVEWMSETFEMEFLQAAMILRAYRAWRKNALMSGMGMLVSETPQLDAIMAEMKMFVLRRQKLRGYFDPPGHILGWERYVADLADPDAAFMRRYQRQKMRHRRNVRQGR